MYLTIYGPKEVLRYIDTSLKNRFETSKEFIEWLNKQVAIEAKK